MDKTILVEKQVQEGKKLLSKLDEANLKIEAAFWLYDSERSSSWRLFLASSSSELDIKKNMSKAYETLSFLMKPSDVPNLILSGVEIISSDHPIIQNIAPLIKTGPGIVDISFTNTLLNRLYVEEIYIYRMNFEQPLPSSES